MGLLSTQLCTVTGLPSCLDLQPAWNANHSFYMVEVKVKFHLFLCGGPVSQQLLLKRLLLPFSSTFVTNQGPYVCGCISALSGCLSCPKPIVVMIVAS